MPHSSWVHVNADCILRESDSGLAFLVRLASNDEEVWIPKSVIADVEDYDVNDENVTLSIAEWFCEKNNIESED